VHRAVKTHLEMVIQSWPTKTLLTRIKRLTEIGYGIIFCV